MLHGMILINSFNFRSLAGILVRHLRFQNVSLWCVCSTLCTILDPKQMTMPRMTNIQIIEILRI